MADAPRRNQPPDFGSPPASPDDPALTARAERRRVVALAGYRGDGATARHALADPDPEVRATALHALHRVGQLTAVDLRAAMADPSPAVRRRVAEVAARLYAPAQPSSIQEAAHGWLDGLDEDTGAAGHGETLDLRPLLADPDATVVEAAAWACGEVLPSSPDTVSALIPLVTEHPDALVREAAVAALGSIGDPRALPAILAATTDRATVRRRAIIALAPFDGPEVDDALRRALDDRDWQVRQVAEDLSHDGSIDDPTSSDP